MSARLAPGSVIDGFTLGECLHDGGMGFIYRVSGGADPGFPMIMKMPRVGQGQPVEGLVGFEMESMILSRLRSPHAPRFVAAGDLARTPYLVMEWIDAELLEDRVASAPLPAESVAAIGAAIARALDSLHQQDVIHLDLKPGNVLLRPDGSAVLIDFGLAHHARLPDLLAEELRRAVGSPAYLSPEQVLGVRNDPRSDQFALGVMLYEMATGELPFGAPRSVSGLRDRLWLEPRPPRALVPDLPPWLQEVILRALEPLARARYPSVSQLGADLRHPGQVMVGERGARRRRAGLLPHLRRWLGAAGREGEILAAAPSRQLEQAPIVVAAVDVEHLHDEMQRALQTAVARVIANAPGARLSAVAIIRPTAAIDGADDQASASAIHLDRLARLRHWIEPLALPPERFSVHVIESGDKARALLEYARGNQASLIVLGAAHYSEPALGLGRSLTTEVVEEAGCSVYVVRAGARAAPGG
jgi:nucleotide-binding universal stress UspA family protein